MLPDGRGLDRRPRRRRSPPWRAARRRARRGPRPCHATGRRARPRATRRRPRRPFAARPRPRRSRLRELQIVELVDQGLSNKEIASQLCIELPTVKNHVHRILEKLGVRRRAEAAALLRARPRGRRADGLGPVRAGVDESLRATRVEPNWVPAIHRHRAPGPEEWRGLEHEQLASTRILVADLPRLQREVVTELLLDRADVEMVEATALCEAAEHRRPDVVILGEDDPALARALLEARPGSSC